MTGISMQVHMDNYRATHHLHALASADTTPLIREFSEYLVERTLENFESETAPDGSKWEKSQRAKDQGGKTLQFKGHLRDSYVYQLLSDKAAEIGSNLVYAAIHHFGGTTRAHVIKAKKGKALKTPYGFFKRVNHPGSKMPARPALGVNADDEDHLHQLAMDWIKGLPA